MIKLRAIISDQRASSAAEFAMVLPLMVLFLLGIIDTGRFLWEYNQAEKATQMGVRYAVATDLVPSGLSTYSFAVSGGITPGNPVPTTSFDRAICNTTDCSDCLPSGGFCNAVSYNASAFDAIVTRMAMFYAPITDTRVTVEYRNVNLGYAGDPESPDVAPLVTVRLSGLTFQPLVLFGGTISMPDFSAALTLEDGSGSVSN